MMTVEEVNIFGLFFLRYFSRIDSFSLTDVKLDSKSRKYSLSSADTHILT